MAMEYKFSHSEMMGMPYAALMLYYDKLIETRQREERHFKEAQWRAQARAQLDRIG